MSATQGAAFACESCGKSYRWRAELAGKRVKCACGHVMRIAAPPPPPPESLADASRDAPLTEAPRRSAAPGAACPSCGAALEAGAVLCVGCGFNLDTGAKAVTKYIAGVPVFAQPKSKGGGKGTRKRVRGEESFAHRRLLTDGDDVEKRAKFIDLYLPSALVALGVFVAFAGALWAAPRGTAGLAMVKLIVSTVIDLALITVALLITARLMSIGLGSIPIVILKVSAIAILPEALSSFIRFKFPYGGAFFGWLTSLLLYYVLLQVLFEMDLFETILCTVIMWAIRTWVGWFLVFLLFSLLGPPSPQDLRDDAFDEEPRPRIPRTAPRRRGELPLSYPIAGGAAVVFFDPRRNATYHSWIGDAVPA